MTSPPVPGSDASETAATQATAVSAEARAVDHNSRVFASLVAVGDARARAGRFASAAEWCRLAASFAMTNSPGALRSAALEEVVDTIAESTLTPGPGEPKGDAREPRQRRVLHVLSEAHEIGGLTRLVERWVTRDEGSRSTVVLTRQQEVLSRLATAAGAGGGAAYAQGDDSSSTIARAQRLRAMAADADVVICHLQSDDVIPALAFGRGYSGPPVALYNHADHIFWLAPTRMSAVIDAREVGALLTREGRGYSAEAQQVLALPVPRASARASSVRPELGVRDTQVLAVSVARPVKFASTAVTPTFGELVDEALNSNPELVFCAVGPNATEEPWPALLRTHGDRIRVTGRVSDPGPFLASADIYLDPFPFSSTTSMLEASAAGLPTLTLDVHRGLRRALGLGDFVVCEEDRPADVAAYMARLADLVRDPEARSSSAALAFGGYLAATAEERWLSQLRQLYAGLDDLHRRGMTVSGTRAPQGDARLADYAEALIAVEQNVPLLHSLWGSMRRFDRRDRISLGVRIRIHARLPGRAGSADDAQVRPLPSAGGRRGGHRS